MIEFNINNYVKIKLTTDGREILRKKGLDFYIDKEDQYGWSKWQLWNLLQTFGEHIFLGCDLPFESNIKILTTSEYLS